MFPLIYSGFWTNRLYTKKLFTSWQAPQKWIHLSSSGLLEFAGNGGGSSSRDLQLFSSTPWLEEPSPAETQVRQELFQPRTDLVLDLFHYWGRNHLLVCFFAGLISNNSRLLLLCVNHSCIHGNLPPDTKSPSKTHGLRKIPQRKHLSNETTTKQTRSCSSWLPPSRLD